MIFYKIFFFSFVLMLIYCGSRRKPGFSSWHMFASLNMMHFKLDYRFHNNEEDWRPLEPFDFLPHTHLSMSKNELKWFLVYLGKIRRMEVKGECTYFHGNKIEIIKIEKNRIVT